MTGEDVEPARLADASQFFTYQNPERYHVDWKGFYDRALIRRKSLLQHHHHWLNVRYGCYADNIMDIVVPEKAQSAPVILYFHGGRWREGHPAFYDFLAEPWVRSGAIFVSCGYRLEPEYAITDAIDDAVAVVNWWAAHAAAYGGDPQRLTMAGHSAGGHLTAMVALTDVVGNLLQGCNLSGAIMMSAPVDLAFMADDPAATKAISPVKLISRAPAHVVLSYGDPEVNNKGPDILELPRQGKLLDAALMDAGIPHDTICLGATDHISTAVAFMDDSSPLYAAAHRAIF